MMYFIKKIIRSILRPSEVIQKVRVKFFNADLYIIKIKRTKVKWLLDDYLKLKKQSDQSFIFGNPYLISYNKEEEAGQFMPHYFLQDIIVAQKIFKANPIKHVDIGSRIDGFVTHVAAYREIEIFDIRPLSVKIENISFIQGDLTGDISSYHNYTDSLSCLHALEHFGLGRYGDPVDYFGHIKGFKNITSIIKKDGKLYLSVPIGSQRIEFNAHRVFSVNYLINLFKNDFKIDNFSYIDDAENVHEHIDYTSQFAADNFNCRFGLAIIEATKL